MIDGASGEYFAVVAGGAQGGAVWSFVASGDFDEDACGLQVGDGGLEDGVVATPVTPGVVDGIGGFAGVGVVAA